MNRPTPTLHLEQQRFGERAAVAADAAARAALDADDAALLERLPPAMIAARVRAALDTPERKPSPSSSSLLSGRWIWLAGPAAVAAALVVAVLPGSAVDAPDTLAFVADTRLKGLTPGLDLQQQQGTKTTTLRAGDVVGAGDVVQIRTRAADAVHGVIVSVDGRGGVTRHFPDDGVTTLPTGTASLPFSFELDDAPGFERFFFVTAASPIDVAVVENAVATLAKKPEPATATLDLPADLRWSDFLLRKR